MKTQPLKINDQAGVALDAGNSNIPLTVTLRTEIDVEELLRKSRALFHPLLISEISLDVEGLPAEVRAVLEADLNSYLQECGCPAGQFTAAAGLLVYVSLLFIIVGAPIHWTWSHLLMGIPICLSLAVIGKLASQFRARIKFINGLESILRLRHVHQQQ